MYYLSSMLLVLFFVVSTNFVAATAPSAELKCTANGLSLTFNKTQLDAAGRNYTIKFNGQSSIPCMIADNSINNIGNETIWIQADYNGCGIEISEKDDNIVYNQTVVVTYGNNPNNSLIQREEEDEYNVKCQKSRNFTKSLEVFNVTKNVGRTVDKVGNTSFEIDFARYKTSSFSQVDNTGTLELGDMFYFHLELKTSRDDIAMSPQNCYATKENGGGKYYLIKDKCENKDDRTVKILTGSSNTTKFQWENEAFRYFGENDEIYIHCDVLICANSTDSNCQRCGTNTRKRRDLSTDLKGNIQVEGTTKEVGISSALIILVDGRQAQTPNNNNGDSSSVFAGTKGTIIIVLMSLFVFIVAIAVVKKVFLTPASTATLVPPVTMKGVEAGYINKGMA